MIQDYITTNLNKATYEMIDGGKQFYAEVKGLRGVWAVGKTLEECRHNLMTTIEGWMIIRFKKNLSIPNPHREDISVDLLSRILRRALISRDEWNNA